MIPNVQRSCPTRKLCTGGEGVFHEWSDEVDRSPRLHKKPRAIQACPDHDGLPNSTSTEHLLVAQGARPHWWEREGRR